MIIGCLSTFITHKVITTDPITTDKAKNICSDINLVYTIN